jgi:archaellum component FlaC
MNSNYRKKQAIDNEFKRLKNNLDNAKKEYQEAKEKRQSALDDAERLYR